MNDLTCTVNNAETYQIVCLEHQQTYLYGEVIQIIACRQMAWVRPLLLYQRSPLGVATEPLSHSPAVFDLRQGSDLFWPLQLFRPALDTEVLPLFAQFQAWDAQPESDRLISRHQLHQFIQQVWQACPAAFAN
ncbi:MAG: hypothetical protein KME35_11090 [Aphanocapsa sp. GSE-SYN-MK-11-07L]|nr:hypothetical protein [Aphanocapsa sp. GSE-SYN-MK-11-07L]